MDINVTQPFSHKAVIFYKVHHFFMTCLDRCRERSKQREDCRSVLERTAGDFTDDKWMTEDLSVFQPCCKLGVSFPQVSDPYRSVDKDHTYLFAILRRGIGFNFISVPPSSASLLLLSLAINASRPSRTSEVFSLIPVNSDALSSSLSSIFKVVRIVLSPCKGLKDSAANPQLCARNAC